MILKNGIKLYPTKLIWLVYVYLLKAGCTAGIVEHFIILPFDNIKTHSQYKLYENKSYL